MRYEFKVTSKPDFSKGKGTPVRAQLHIDGKLVGQADFPVTTPLSLGLTGGDGEFRLRTLEHRPVEPAGGRYSPERWGWLQRPGHPMSSWAISPPW